MPTRNLSGFTQIIGLTSFLLAAANARPQALKDVSVPAIPPHPGYRNTRVNQDLNVYAKSIGGVAVDPTDPRNTVVYDNDNRRGPLFTNDFFHVTGDDGIRWADDADPLAIVAVSDEDSGPALTQRSVGTGFDSTGHTFNALAIQNGLDYYNDTTVAVSIGMDHGNYVNDLPSVVATNVCGIQDYGCSETLRTQGVAVDNSAAATNGTVYVFYNVICDVYTPQCEDTIAGSSTIFRVAQSPAWNQPFGPPQIWSLPPAPGKTLYGGQAAGGSLVIDAHGTPYLFFADMSNSPKIDLWQSTNGKVAAVPAVEFADAGLGNAKWTFPEDKQFQCAEHAGVAYCAFAATQAGTAPAASTPSVFLAAIDLADGKARLTRVNNDPFSGGKDHFNPSVAVTPNGYLYVGWFDNRKDPARVKVNYYVAKSIDGGRTFVDQRAVNDVAFDPTIGGAGPSGSIVATARNTVKAFWTDTRDGATQQIWSEEVE